MIMEKTKDPKKQEDEEVSAPEDGSVTEEEAVSDTKAADSPPEDSTNALSKAAEVKLKEMEEEEDQKNAESAGEEDAVGEPLGDDEVPCTPGEMDVLFGRGKTHMFHRGNKEMQKLVEKYRKEYDRSTRDGKTDIAWRIVKEIQHNTKGRFLRLDKSRKLWFEVPDEAARNKVSHAMRDGRSKAAAASLHEAAVKEEAAAAAHKARLAAAVGAVPGVTAGQLDLLRAAPIQQLVHPSQYLQAAPLGPSYGLADQRLFLAQQQAPQFVIAASPAQVPIYLAAAPQANHPLLAAQQGGQFLLVQQLLAAQQAPRVHQLDLASLGYGQPDNKRQRTG